MEIAKLGNVDIAYHRQGAGRPILLIHGFASTASVNWQATGWYETLMNAGFEVIAIDNRGHGGSTKFYEEDAYQLETMADDAAALLDHLNIGSANIMGYSMGGRISAMLAYRHPEKVLDVILAGNGYNMVIGGFPSSTIRDGLNAESFDKIETETGRAFRRFAEQTNSDLRALAACIMGVRSNIEADLFQHIKKRVLVTIGTEDTVAVDGEKLASLMPNAQFEPIPKRNHMNAVGDKAYKSNVLIFLGGD